MTLNNILINNININDHTSNKNYIFEDIYLDNTDKQIKPYFIDTPNLLYIDSNKNKYIFFIGQFGHNLIKINPSGLIENEPTETTYLYFLDCLSNNLYYNIFNIYSSAIGYLETNLNNINVTKIKYLQLIESVNKDDTFILYFLDKLHKYFDIFDIKIDEENNNIKELIEKTNIFSLSQKLPSIYLSNDFEYEDIIIKSRNKFIDTKYKVTQYKNIYGNPIMTNILENKSESIKFIKNLIDELQKNINTYNITYNNIYPDILYNLLYKINENNYTYIRHCIDINNLSKIIAIIEDETIDDETKLKNYSDMNKNSIFVEDVYVSHSVFELLFGNYIRKEQIDLINNIHKSIYTKQREIFSFLMGAGKTSVVAPMLTLESCREKENFNIFHVMPSSLVKSSYLLNMQFIYPIYQSILYLPDTELKNINMKTFSKINITSDNFIKTYKINKVTTDEYWNTFETNNVFIFDEIDELANPLKNQLNITICKENDEKIKNIIVYSKLVCDKIYDLEQSKQDIYKKIFTDEDFFNIKNTKEARNLYKNIYMECLKNIIDGNTKLKTLFTSIDITNDNFNDIILDKKQGYYEGNDELNEYIDMFYNIYINSLTVFNSRRNISYGLSKISIESYKDLYDTHKINNLFTSLPYSAIDTPVYGSEFSNIYQKILFTISSYYNRNFIDNKNSFSSRDLYLYLKDLIYDKYIELLKGLNNMEIEYDILLDEYINLFKKSKYENDYPSIELIKDLNFNEEHKQYLIEKIFSEKQNIIKYVNLILIKSLTNYKMIYNISTTDLLVSRFTNYRTGFTGTPNMHIPYDIFESETSFKQEINDTNVDIIKNSIIVNKKNPHFIESPSINNLIQVIIDNSYSVLIDSGAFIKQDINIIINILYEKLIVTNKFKCLIFIDSHHSKKVLYKNSNSEKILDNFSKNLDIPLKERFYLFDHKHITGQDFIIYRQAIGLVTFRYDSRLRDIAQGIYRLRQINKGQTCKIVGLQTDFNNYNDLSYQNVYDILLNNDTEFKKNTLNIFIRQNLYAILRTYYETTNKSYYIDKTAEHADICNSLISIFADNLYLLYNVITSINIKTFKKTIDEILFEDIKTYILSKNSENDIYKKLNDIIRKSSTETPSEITINTNIQTEIETQIEMDTTVQEQVHQQRGEIRTEYLDERLTYGRNFINTNCIRNQIDITQNNIDKLFNLFIKLAEINKMFKTDNYTLYYFTTNDIVFKSIHNSSLKLDYVAYLVLINNDTSIYIILLDIYSLLYIIHLLDSERTSYSYQIKTLKNQILFQSENFNNTYLNNLLIKYFCNSIINTYRNNLLGETQEIAYLDILGYIKFQKNTILQEKNATIFELYERNDKYLNLNNIFYKPPNIDDILVSFNKFNFHINEKINKINKILIIKFIEALHYSNYEVFYNNILDNRPDIFDKIIYKLLFGIYNKRKLTYYLNFTEYYDELTKLEKIKLIFNKQLNNTYITYSVSEKDKEGLQRERESEYDTERKRTESERKREDDERKREDDERKRDVEKEDYAKKQKNEEFNKIEKILYLYCVDRIKNIFFNRMVGDDDKKKISFINDNLFKLIEENKNKYFEDSNSNIRETLEEEEDRLYQEYEKQKSIEKKLELELELNKNILLQAIYFAFNMIKNYDDQLEYAKQLKDDTDSPIMSYDKKISSSSEKEKRHVPEGKASATESQRKRAEEAEIKRVEDERKRAEEAERKRAEEAERKRVELEAERKRAEEAERKRVELEAERKRVELEAERKRAEEAERKSVEQKEHIELTPNTIRELLNIYNMLKKKYDLDELPPNIIEKYLRDNSLLLNDDYDILQDKFNEIKSPDYKIVNYEDYYSKWISLSIFITYIKKNILSKHKSIDDSVIIKFVNDKLSEITGYGGTDITRDEKISISKDIFREYYLEDEDYINKKIKELDYAVSLIRNKTLDIINKIRSTNKENKDTIAQLEVEKNILKKDLFFAMAQNDILNIFLDYNNIEIDEILTEYINKLKRERLVRYKETKVRQMERKQERDFEQILEKYNFTKDPFGIGKLDENDDNYLLIGQDGGKYKFKKLYFNII
jgi:hypothetical protein